MSQSIDERDRRWSLLAEAMVEHDLDAIVFAANDYRGHKGSLRYVADYNLCHKHGNAVMLRDREPVLVLAGSLVSARKPTSGWVSDYRFPQTTGAGLVEALKESSRLERVGVIGLGSVLKVNDHLAITEAFPQCDFLDFTKEFERIRAVKSPWEIVGVEESAHILDQCFSRLLEIARPGITEREVVAEMHRTGHLLGGEDPIFLSMHTDEVNPHSISTFDSPRDRALQPHDVMTISFEMIGPRGYWTELARMVTFAPPEEATARMARAVADGIREGAATMVPGTAPGDIQRAVLEGVERHGARTSYWSGHSLGLDVIEDPMIGLDVVEDPTQMQATTIEAGMVITLHPMVQDTDAVASGYMSDTFVVDEGGSRRLSEHPLALHRISRGEVIVHD